MSQVYWVFMFWMFDKVCYLPVKVSMLLDILLPWVLPFFFRKVLCVCLHCSFGPICVVLFALFVLCVVGCNIVLILVVASLIATFRVCFIIFPPLHWSFGFRSKKRNFPLNRFQTVHVHPFKREVREKNHVHSSTYRSDKDII